MENNVSSLMDTTLEKIKQMVDTDTVMGTPIVCGDSTIIPVSKVTYGFGSGGSDFAGKNVPQPSNLFGGGAGAGVTITPIAFLTVTNGDVKLLQISPISSTADRAIEMIPDVVDKVSSFFKKDKKTTEKSTNNIDIFDDEDFSNIK